MVSIREQQQWRERNRTYIHWILLRNHPKFQIRVADDSRIQSLILTVVDQGIEKWPRQLLQRWDRAGVMCKRFYIVALYSYHHMSERRQ